MLPEELVRVRPGNLSRQAARDYLRILRESHTRWGLATALRTRDRLMARCYAIRTGSVIGHGREDVKTRHPILFTVEPPFVLAYNAETGNVVRILHGAREFSRLFI